MSRDGAVHAQGSSIGRNMFVKHSSHAHLLLSLLLTYAPFATHPPAYCCSAPLSRYGSTVVPAAPELEALLSAAEAADGQVSLDQLQTLFSFRLDDFQAQAVQVLLNGKSVVVCAPTGMTVRAGADKACAVAGLCWGQCAGGQ